MKIIQEFKEFAVRGNVIDLAVGVVIGAAFGKIVSSLVADIIMPPIGYLLSGVDFASMAWVIREGHDKVLPVSLNYGKFIQAIFDFSIIAFAIFMFVKSINKLKSKIEKPIDEVPVVIELTKEEILLTEIRDLLKKQD